MAAKSDECIQVVIRCRPLSRKEKEENRLPIVDIDAETRQIAIRNPDIQAEQPKSFTFDGTFDENTQQKFFYEEACFNLIESVLEGFNGTIFAYGQTGCGKSWTMQGGHTPDLKGVIPNSFSHIFEYIKASKDVQFLIRCSYLEIYNEEIKDLLGDNKNPVKCEIKEDPGKGVYVKNLATVVVETEEEMSAQLDRGLSFRTVAATLMNSESSRSHSIFSIVVEMSTTDVNGKEHVKAGKLNLVDLAGSERQKKTGASGALLKEGAKINLSLSALGNVISALSEGKSKHVPYRDSKLTRLLQDSLGGNTKTLMVAAISPADYNFDETLSTLRYANRAKNIKNKPKINEDPKDTMIREFREEIERLKKMVEQGNNNNSTVGASAPVLATMAIDVGASQQQSASMLALEEQMRQQEEQEKKLLQLQQQLKQQQEYHERLQEEQKQQLLQYQQHHQDPRSPVSSPHHAPHLLPKLQPSVAPVDPLHHQQQQQMQQQLLEPIVVEKIVVQKEIVHVEVERIPEAHLMRQKELEDLSKSIEEERNRAHTLLAAREAQMLLEAKEKEDLQARLQRLQSKLVGHVDVIVGEESAKEKSERMEADRVHKERRAIARKRREAQQQRELLQVLDEKRAMEDELEELRQSVSVSVSSSLAGGGGQGGESEEMAVKKLNKLRKKYDKKLSSLRQEIVDLKDEYSSERLLMMEVMDEQKKDAKLYEQICQSLLSEKDLKKLIDKCRYNEEEDEWIVPLLKKKEVPYGNTTTSNNTSTSSSSSSSFLPDINGGQPKYYAETVASLVLNGSTVAFNNTGHPYPRVQSRGNAGANGAGGSLDFNLTINGATLSHHMMGASVSTSQAVSARGDGGPGAGLSQSLNTVSPRAIIGTARVPLLTIQQQQIQQQALVPTAGNGAVAASLFSQTINSDINLSLNLSALNGNNGNGNGNGIVTKVKKSARADKKVKSKPPDPKPFGVESSRNDASAGLPDEAGAGQFAGPLTDWGFADEGIASKYSKNRAANANTNTNAAANNDDPEYYSNDEFEPIDNINGSCYSQQYSQASNTNNSSRNGGAGGAYPPTHTSTSLNDPIPKKKKISKQASSSLLSISDRTGNNNIMLENAENDLNFPKINNSKATPRNNGNVTLLPQLI